MNSRLTIAAELNNLPALRQFLDETGAIFQADQEVINCLIQAVDEAATNIILHGYQGEPGIIEIEVGLDGDVLVVRLRDNAPLYDPTQIPPPELPRPPEDCEEGGVGMHLVRHFVDEVVYRVTPDGRNELSLSKKLS